jgi:anti-sigma-K factor RskA
LLSAAAVVVLGLAIVWTLRLQDRVEEQSDVLARLQTAQHERDDVLAILADQNMLQCALTGTADAPSATALLYADPSANTAVFASWNLPALPGDKAYQLWLIDAGGVRTSGGVFQVSSDGSAVFLVHAPQPLSSYRNLGVTVEPTRGSAGPTGVRVLTGSM